MNYADATVSEISEHFKFCSRQCIYSTRKRYKGTELQEKIESAYIEYKIGKVLERDRDY